MPMKIGSVIAAAALLFCVSSSASAGDGSGMITKLTAYGTVVVFSVGDHSNKAACSSDGAFVINASTPEGKTMYATLLTAVSAGRPLYIFSANTCPTWWSNAETPNSVTITP
jgi:hypothetical protein